MFIKMIGLTIRVTLIVVVGSLLVLFNNHSVDCWGGSSKSQQQNDNNVNLETICDNKKVSLRSISQVQKLIFDFKQERPDSCKSYYNSFIELEPILNVIEKGQVCNLELTNLLRDYHLTHINMSEKRNLNDKIPNPLRYFFISLAFQISAECKMTLINSLEYDTKDTITEEDYKTTDLLEQYGVSLLDKNAKVEDFDDILLLNDVNAAVGFDAGSKDTKILIKVKTNLMLKNLILTCTNKFKPYYEKLILPLVALSNLGYNYRGELLDRELKELKDSQLIRRWYNIVQTCEAFRTIEIFEDDETVLDNQQAITLISREEAQELKSKQLNKSENNNQSAAINYDPAPSHNSDELWIQDQEELDRLVNKYKASVSESDRIKSKLMNKIFDKFKQSLKAGKIGIFVSGIYNGLTKNKNEDRTNINEDMVNMMDNVITKTEKTTEINLIDEPVAGGRYRYPPRKPGQGRAPGRVPPRIALIPEPENQSKTFTDKLFDRTIGRLIPSKFDMLMWFLGIIGLLLIGCAIVG